MQAFALVDYDNAKLFSKENKLADVFANLEAITATVCDARKQCHPATGELIIRLYGGWIDEDGRYTALAQWLLATAPNFRGRRGGARLRVDLITCLASLPGVSCIGTYRKSNRAQKMVDTMLSADLLFLSEMTDCPLLIFSDDDDFVPPILHAAHLHRPPTLLRSRAFGLGINDHHLHARKVSIWTIGGHP